MGTATPSAVPFSRVFIQNLQVTRRVRANRKRGSQFDVMPVTAGRYVSGTIVVWRSGRGEVMSTVWSAIVLVLAAVITAVWIGVLGFGLMHLIEHAI
jgi:hypothetical protein